MSKRSINLAGAECCPACGASVSAGPSELWTAEEVASFLKVRTKTVHTWRKDGRLEAYGQLPGGAWRFDPDEVRAMVRRGAEEKPLVADVSAIINAEVNRMRGRA